MKSAKQLIEAPELDHYYMRGYTVDQDRMALSISAVRLYDKITGSYGKTRIDAVSVAAMAYPDTDNPEIDNTAVMYYPVAIPVKKTVLIGAFDWPVTTDTRVEYLVKNEIVSREQIQDAFSQAKRELQAKIDREFRPVEPLQRLTVLDTDASLEELARGLADFKFVIVRQPAHLGQVRSDYSQKVARLANMAQPGQSVYCILTRTTEKVYVLADEQELVQIKSILAKLGRDVARRKAKEITNESQPRQAAQLVEAPELDYEPVASYAVDPSRISVEAVGVPNPSANLATRVTGVKVTAYADAAVLYRDHDLHTQVVTIPTDKRGVPFDAFAGQPLDGAQAVEYTVKLGVATREQIYAAFEEAKTKLQAKIDRYFRPVEKLDKTEVLHTALTTTDRQLGNKLSDAGFTFVVVNDSTKKGSTSKIASLVNTAQPGHKIYQIKTGKSAAGFGKSDIYVLVGDGELDLLRNTITAADRAAAKAAAIADLGESRHTLVEAPELDYHYIHGYEVDPNLMGVGLDVVGPDIYKDTVHVTSVGVTAYGLVDTDSEEPPESDFTAYSVDIPVNKNISYDVWVNFPQNGSEAGEYLEKHGVTTKAEIYAAFEEAKRKLQAKIDREFTPVEKLAQTTTLTTKANLKALRQALVDFKFVVVRLGYVSSVSKISSLANQARPGQKVYHLEYAATAHGLGTPFIYVLADDQELAELKSILARLDREATVKKVRQDLGESHPSQVVSQLINSPGP